MRINKHTINVIKYYLSHILYKDAVEKYTTNIIITRCNVLFLKTNMCH